MLSFLYICEKREKHTSGLYNPKTSLCFCLTRWGEKKKKNEKKQKQQI